MSVTSAVHHVAMSPYELLASALLSNHKATAVRIFASSIANPGSPSQAIGLGEGLGLGDGHEPSSATPQLGTEQAVP